MILVVHQVLSREEEYVEFGEDYYDRRNKPKTVAPLVKRLQGLGFEVSLRAEADAEITITDLEPWLATRKRTRERPLHRSENGVAPASVPNGELVAGTEPLLTLTR